MIEKIVASVSTSLEVRISKWRNYRETITCWKRSRHWTEEFPLCRAKEGVAKESIWLWTRFTRKIVVARKVRGCSALIYKGSISFLARAAQADERERESARARNFSRLERLFAASLALLYLSVISRCRGDDERVRVGPWNPEPIMQNHRIG